MDVSSFVSSIREHSRYVLQRLLQRSDENVTIFRIFLHFVSSAVFLLPCQLFTYIHIHTQYTADKKKTFIVQLALSKYDYLQTFLDKRASSIAAL